MARGEVRETVDAIAISENGNLVLPPEFIEHLMRRPWDLVRQRLIQCLITAAPFHQYGERDRSMFDLNGCVVLSRAVLVNREVIATNIGNEVAVWVLNEHFNRHDLRRGVKVDLCLLLALLSLKQGRGWSIRYVNLSSRCRICRRAGPLRGLDVSPLCCSEGR